MQFNRFLLTGYSLGLIFLAQCNKNDVPATSDSVVTPAAAVASANTSAGSVPLVKEGLSPAFRSVTSHLDLGGCSFSYAEVNPGSSWASMLDSILSVVPESERKDFPPGFSFGKIFNVLGLDSVTAVGSSARQRSDGTFHSRAIAYAPSGRIGLLSLTGGPATKLLLLEMAPKETDLGIELSLDIKDFMRDSWPKLLSLVPSEERAKMEAEASQPIPPLGLSTKQILEKIDIRLGLFIQVDPSQNVRLSPTSPPIPGMDGILVIDHLGWLIEALKPQFMPMLKDPSAPVEVTDADGVLTIRAKGPLSVAPLDYQPVVRYDAKADRILIATRPAAFDTALSGKGKFTQRTDYAEIWRDLPTEGNDCIFVSKKYLQLIGDNLASLPSLQGSGASAADTAIIGKIVEWAKPLLGRSQAVVLANQADGITTASNMTIAFNPTNMTGISTLAIMASLAVPAFNKVQEKGTQTKEMSSARQVVLALRLYASTHGGKYPEKLDELRTSDSLTDPKILMFNDPTTHTPTPWFYNSSLTESSPATEPLLISPSAFSGGKRIAAFNDGSVRIITEAEFEAIKAKR